MKRLLDFVSQKFIVALLLTSAFGLVLYRLSIPLQSLGPVNWFEVGFRTLIASLVLLFLSRDERCSNLSLVTILMALATVLHFPGNLTFHWDEWEVLWRYADHGAKSSLAAHGAHVMPVFMLYFLGQVELLQFSYSLMLLVSCILVGVNGYVLYRFLLALGTEHWFDRRAVRFVSCLFVISSLQLEVSQWAFIQCVTMQNIATIFAASKACDWRRTSARRDLLLSLFALAIAPLLQGTGVVTAGFCVLAMIIAAALDWVRGEKVQHLVRTGVSVVLRFTLYATLASIPTIILYVVLGTSPEAPDLSLDMFKHSNIMLAFFLNGTLGVTLMRGLGFFPSLSMDLELTNRFWSMLPAVLQKVIGSAEHTVVCLGALVLLGFALLLFSDRPRRGVNIVLFLSGCLIVTSFFILPTLGRWQYGVSASIFSRYQTRHLIGLALLALPLVSRFLIEAKAATQLVIVWLLLLGHIGLQTYMEASFNHFIEYGQRTELLLCRAQNHPDQRIRKEIETTILPHWAFTGDVLRHVLKTHGLRCRITGSSEVHAANPSEI